MALLPQAGEEWREERGGGSCPAMPMPHGRTKYKIS